MEKSKKIKVLSVVLIAAAVQIENERLKTKKKNRAKRRIWSREWLLRRYSGKDLTHMAVNELNLEDPKSFFNFTRMSKISFDKLLSIVGPCIRRQDTQLREPISVTTRLLITLRFLATGNTYHDLSYGFRVSVPSISVLVPETLKAIYTNLSKEYLKGCKTENDWRDVANNFFAKWNFPMCLGAIDGKHIAFRAKSKDGSFYYNYKGFNSIILMAVVDADYKFIMVDVGTNGRANDASAFNSSDLGHAIKNNLLNFPPNEKLPGTDIMVPYVFVSDDAFRLTSRVLKPYSQRHLKENKIFNYRLSRARRVVENAFGILAHKFQIFMREINLSVDKVELITLTCCVLHNFLRIENREGTCPEETADIPGLERSAGNKSSDEASAVRNIYCNFFNNIDIIPWQNDAIHKFNF